MVSSRAMFVTRTPPSSAASSCSFGDAFPGKMFTNFCWKCSLRTGTFCCGVFSLVISAAGIIANGTLNIQNPYYFSLERSLMFQEVLIFVVSAICIHGALKECRYSLLPWLVITAFSITVLLLTSFYYILLGSFELAMIGLVFLALAGFFIYAWMGVASYYSELRERATATSDSSIPTRDYIDPSAVTSPAAFVAPPPPPYSVAVGADGSALEEKPPSYEEAESSKRQQQERV